LQPINFQDFDKLINDMHKVALSIGRNIL